MTQEMKAEFKKLIQSASEKDLAWMNGYMEAMEDLKSDPAAPVSHIPEPVSSQPPAAPVGVEPAPVAVAASAPPGNSTSAISSSLVIFGTETGNSKKIATSVNQKLKAAGLKTKLTSTSLVKLDELYKNDLIVTVCSTHGDGDPPEAALSFYNALKNAKVPMSAQRFAVLGLGDSSYPLFCQTGKDLDSFFDKLGATRLAPLGMCDVDYAETAEKWTNSVLDALKNAPGVQTGASSIPQTTAASQNGTSAIKAQSNGGGVATMAPPVVATPPGFYPGEVRLNTALTDSMSSKEIRHIEIESEAEIDYQPGDSIGVIPCNERSEVMELLHALRLDADTQITWREQTGTLRELLENKISIRYLPARVMKGYEDLTLKKLPPERMDLVDILVQYPPNEAIDKQKIINLLEPITPRWYSISSSPEHHGRNEVHITVADVEIEAQRRQYRGLCTGHLFASPEGTRFPFKIQKNNNFRIPSPDTDIIMIGPGTGIAPFRSFLFEREALGHTGKNWLFFGNRNFAHDFLYQTELLDFFDSGTLTKINTAFSRDGDRKIYVQHRLLEHGKELYKWLENGAIIYVCGSKYPMSKDVDEALFKVIEKERRNGRKDAEAYFEALIEADRYKKDVY